VILDVLKEHNAFTCERQAAQEESLTTLPWHIRSHSSTERASYPGRPKSSEKHLWEP